MRAMRGLAPLEDFIYFGDTAHLPYGEKSNEAIRSYSLRIVDFLLEKNSKAIVIACNTASAVATDVITAHVGPEIPVINVIDPAIAVVPENTTHVGVIGTRATVSSEIYQKKLRERLADTRITAMATPLLVPIIEEGLEQSSIARSAARHYLEMPEMQGIDVLIPGCTHYPLLTSLFQSILGNVRILNTPEIVAEAVQKTLESRGIATSETSKGTAQFYVSDYTPTFERIARNFFGEGITLKERDIWSSDQR